MTDRNKIEGKNIFVRVLCIILFIVLLPIVLIWLLVKACLSKSRKEQALSRISIFKISQIDTLSGVEFEQYLFLLFKKMGYKVSLTRASNDFGADLILSMGSERGVVQAKRYNSTVGVSAVQQAHSAKAHYGAEYAIVITNNYFSVEAKKLAKENSVTLIDRDGLQNLVTKYDITVDRQKEKYSALKKERVAEIEGRYPFFI